MGMEFISFSSSAGMVLQAVVGFGQDIFKVWIIGLNGPYGVVDRLADVTSRGAGAVPKIVPGRVNT